MKNKSIFYSIRTFIKELVSYLNIVKQIKLEIQKTRDLKFRRKQLESEFKELTSSLPQNNKVFIVTCGTRDSQKLRLCINFLRNNLKLEPVYLSEAHIRNHSNFNISFYTLAKDCSAAVIIFNHDFEDEKIKERVIYQLGYFTGKFEKEKRVIVINRRGSVFPPQFTGVPVTYYHRFFKDTYWDLHSHFKAWGFPASEV